MPSRQQQREEQNENSGQSLSRSSVVKELLYEKLCMVHFSHHANSSKFPERGNNGGAEVR